ncbi:MAG: hypothetical protein MUO31_06600 [Thermodesulfovibrionales bacterium]|nr:hypothetical protein [Thermodesulfovibrionales bacterium]
MDMNEVMQVLDKGLRYDKLWAAYCKLESSEQARLQRTDYDKLKASHDRLVETLGSKFIKTFVPYDKDSECYRAYNELKQALAEAEKI